MTTFNSVTVHQRQPGAWQITMNREAVFNAFNEEMIEELGIAFDQLIENADVHVIVLAGSGKHFSAGADLKWMQRASKASIDWNLQDARKFAAMLSKIERCPKPTVARVQGVALGGGTGLVCACDMAVAADDARFAISEAKFGILPSVIGPYVINAIGKRQAQYLALTTSRINALQALNINLIQKRVELPSLDDAVDEVLTELMAGGPNAQAEIKKLFAQLYAGPISDEVKELTAQTISRVRSTDEAREGFAAFLDKRSANWIPTTDNTEN